MKKRIGLCESCNTIFTDIDEPKVRITRLRCPQCGDHLSITTNRKYITRKDYRTECERRDALARNPEKKDEPDRIVSVVMLGFELAVIEKKTDERLLTVSLKCEDSKQLVVDFILKYKLTVTKASAESFPFLKSLGGSSDDRAIPIVAKL